MDKSVLGIFPHPDDEAYAAGGTLALAAQAGARVHVLAMTRGESGQQYHGSESGLKPLALVRSDELACSCRTLGAEIPRFLELPDGHVADADFPVVVARLVAVIRELRPEVIISLGPDGVYGHPDHVASYRLVLAAVRSAAGGERFPEAAFGRSHAVARLLLCAFPPGMFRPQYELMLTSDLGPAVRLVDPRRLGTAPADIAVEIDVRSAAGRKLTAMACHRSQLPGEDPRGLFPAAIVDALLEWERFSLHGGERLPAPLSDIFAGLPAAGGPE